MTVRITSAPVKAATIVAACIVITFVVAFVGFGVSPTAGALAGTALVVVAVVFCTRTFRGDSEVTVPPRAWWRLTERPTSGFVLFGLFAVQAVWVAVQPGTSGDLAARIAGAIVAGLIAVAFLGSSVRLVRERTD
jgi:hypothetical protein